MATTQFHEDTNVAAAPALADPELAAGAGDLGVSEGLVNVRLCPGKPVPRIELIRAAVRALQSRAEASSMSEPSLPPRAPLGLRVEARPVALPPLAPAERRRRLEAATAFLKEQGVLVSVIDREAPVRTYRVSGRRDPLLADEVVTMAASRGAVL